jgi:hypothetical protein
MITKEWKRLVIKIKADQPINAGTVDISNGKKTLYIRSAEAVINPHCIPPKKDEIIAA